MSMETLTKTSEQEKITPNDSASSFINNGFMTNEQSSLILDMSSDDRQDLLKTLSSEKESEPIDEGVRQRLDWLTRQLGKTIIDETVFKEYVTSRPVTTATKAGMASYIYSGGRNSRGLSSNGPQPDAR